MNIIEAAKTGKRKKWESERKYPGGLVIYEPLSDRDRYLIIYRHPKAGDFVRGVISHFDLMQLARELGFGEGEK